MIILCPLSFSTCLKAPATGQLPWKFLRFRRVTFSSSSALGGWRADGAEPVESCARTFNDGAMESTAFHIGIMFVPIMFPRNVWYEVLTVGSPLVQLSLSHQVEIGVSASRFVRVNTRRCCTLFRAHKGLSQAVRHHLWRHSELSCTFGWRVLYGADTSHEKCVTPEACFWPIPDSFDNWSWRSDIDRSPVVNGLIIRKSAANHTLVKCLGFPHLGWPVIDGVYSIIWGKLWGRIPVRKCLEITIIYPDIHYCLLYIHIYIVPGVYLECVNIYICISFIHTHIVKQ